MEAFSFYLLVAASSWVLFMGFSKEAGYLELPMLFAIVYVGWVLPQLWQIRQHVDAVGIEYITTLNSFCLVCLLGTLIGWKQALHAHYKRGWIAPSVPPPSYSYILRATILITLIAWSMRIGIGLHDIEDRNTSTWSGPITILAFFSHLQTLSLFLSFYVALRHRTGIAYALLAANLLLYIPLMLVYFRRRSMIDFFFCALMSLYFTRRILIPKLVLILALPIGVMVVFGIGALRGLAVGDGTSEWQMPRVSDMFAIDFVSLTPFGTDSATTEMMNAVSLVRLADQFGFHTWGAESWNHVVFQWIPAQIVGANLKLALMFDLGVAQRLYNHLYYETPIGSTSTGLGGAYLEFGFLGVLFFAAISYVMGRWWVRLKKGDVWAAALYTCGVPLALHSITHYAFYFFNFIPLFGAALFSAKYFFKPRRRNPFSMNGKNGSAGSPVEIARRNRV